MTLLNAAQFQFMRNLQALDLDNLDAGLRAMSVEAANLFPMISDAGETDGERGEGAAFRLKLLQESIVRVDGVDGVTGPRLTLEQHVLIDEKGMIIDGRNRVAAILRNAGALPVIDYTALEASETPGSDYKAIISAKIGAMDLLNAALGNEPAAFNDADLLFRHIDVDMEGTASQFDTILRRNLARRDLNTSQRACVAANVSAAAFKRFGGPSKPKDSDIADSFGIGHKTMKRAKALKKAAPDLFDAVLNGRLTVAGAEIEMKKRAAPQQAEETTSIGTKRTLRDADGVAGVTAKVEYTEVAIRAGIENKNVDPAEVFDAITAGLGARFGVDSNEYTAIEAALAKMCGIDLD